MRFANIFRRVLEEIVYEKVHQLKKRAPRLAWGGSFPGTERRKERRV